MRFSNNYNFRWNCKVNNLSEKLKKLLGMESASGEIFLHGETSVDITMEELKEIFSSEDDRLRALRNYVASGDMKKDVLEITNTIGAALVRAEEIQREYDSACSETRINQMREDERVDAARSEGK